MNVFEKAVAYAAKAHAGMLRKRECIPYLIHPLEVAVICASMTSDPEILAAAVLHDTVEDTSTTLEEIRNEFGPRVALLVEAETEDKFPGLSPDETWLRRKKDSLKILKETTDPAVKMLWLGDKLANMRSFYRAWKASGNAFWKDFNQKDPAMQRWYYQSILENLEDLRDHDAWKEFKHYVDTVFEGVE